MLRDLLSDYNAGDTFRVIRISRYTKSRPQKDACELEKKSRGEQLEGNVKMKGMQDASCLDGCTTNSPAVVIWGEEGNENQDVFRNTTGNYTYTYEKQTNQSWECDSMFTSLNFWGANIVIFANIIYIVPYVLVLVVYFSIPCLRGRAYNKAVMCYNGSQVLLNAIMIGLGFTVLCHSNVSPDLYTYLGLAIMFLTISSTFWLFVICIDMTLVITRFRLKSSNDSSPQKEGRKFRTYAALSWGLSLLATGIASFTELSPFLPKSSPARPNFRKFNDGANLAVILYVATLPLLTCLVNSILFCYTSYKMIQIQKSTALATSSSTAARVNTAKKRYVLFLKLYCLMDAPWVTSALGAAFTDLWVLKFIRMIQPIMMLFVILPRQIIQRIFKCFCLCRKSKDPSNTQHDP